VTSAPEVRFPRSTDFIAVLLHKAGDGDQSRRAQAMILGEDNSRLEPDLRLPSSVLHMHVAARFLA
jgi:hypothetical protein